MSPDSSYIEIVAAATTKEETAVRWPRILWEEILVCIRDVNARTELLRQRNTIVKDIHTEFRALNIEVPTTVEKNTEAFASFLGDLSDEGKPKESKQPADR